MRNIKRTKILLISVLGFLVISFIPSISASGTIKRPLEDWFYSKGSYMYGTPLNPSVGYWAPYGNFWLSDELIAFNHMDESWNQVPIWDCEFFSGFILDREMSDGKHMITVIMHVKGAPLVIETLDPENYMTVLVGEMDYVYRIKFSIDLTVWPSFLIGWADDDGFDENGNILLPRQDIPFQYYGYFGIELESMLFIGNAKGVLLNAWNGMDAGNEVKVNIGMFAKGTEADIEWKFDFIDIY